MDISKMTVEEFIAMKKAMDEAENDDTPYAIMDTANDELQIVGDPNKTELKKYEYKIQFAYPNTEKWEKVLDDADVKVLKKTDNYLGVERTYKDVWVPPRSYMAVQTSFAELYQFMNVVSDDGEIRDLTDDEIIVALRMLDQEMMDAMYHAVATVLRIPQEEEEFMLPTLTMAAVMAMIKDFPEIINGMDFFSDKSSEKGLTVL